MAPPRRLSGSKDHPPPKKRRVTEPETVQPAVALDPNAIDHSLDLVPPSHFDSFSLDLFEEELNVATDAVMPSLVDGGEAAAPPVEAQDDDADADADEDTQESGKTKTKKKAKRRHSGQQQEQSTPPKMPPAQQPVMDIEEIKNKYGRKRLERIRRQAIKDAWKEYQEETSRVVQQLPEEITSMFGQIGYGKFGKKYFPVLLICPFDVALESVRIEWYQTFEKALEGRLKFAHCGYWIGETNYSPVGQSNFVPHDQATTSHTKAVDTIKRKMAKGSKPKEGTEEAYLVRAIEEVERLMTLDPAERRRSIPHTRHPFEDMSIDEVLKDMQEKNISVEAFENDISDDEGLDEAMDDVQGEADYFEETKPPAVPMDEQYPLDALQKAATEAPGAPKKKKKKKTKAKKAPPAAAEEVAPPQVAAPAPPSARPKDPQPSDDSDDDDDSVDPELEFDDEDIPTDDDKGDDDYDLDAEAEPKHVVADEDLMDELGRSAQSKPRKKKTASTKKAPAKKKEEAEKKKKVPSKRLDIPPEQKTDKQKRDWLLKKFKANERKIVPTLESLHAVTAETSSESIRELLSSLNSAIDEMCFVFIEKHQVPSALKPAKKELKSRCEDFSIVGEIKDRMKTRYEQNKSDYPLKCSPSVCEASYLGTKNVEDEAKSGESSQRRASASGDLRVARKKQSKAPKATGDSLSTMDKGAEKQKRDSIVSEPATKKRKSDIPGSDVGKVSKKNKSDDVLTKPVKRESLDTLSHSERGMKSRESAGSLSRPEKATKLPERGMESRDSSGSLSRIEKSAKQSDRGMKSRVSSASLSRLEKSAKPSDQGMKSRASSGSLSRLEKSTKQEEPIHPDLLAPLEKSSKKKKEPSGETGPPMVVVTGEGTEKRDSIDSLSQSTRGLKKRDDSLSTSRPDKSSKLAEPDVKREDAMSDRTAGDERGEAMRKSVDQANVPRRRDSAQPHSESGRKSPAKPSRPKFSLVGLMKPGSQERSGASSSSQHKTPTSRVPTKAKKQLPSWMCRETGQAPVSRDRLFALEFYKELKFSDKVNREAMSVALENATHDWATAEGKQRGMEKREVMDMYWRKVRAIVAVVSGKYNPGSLMHDILKGKFESAEDLVKIKDSDLAQYLKSEFGFS